jgi:hypothetical protein
MGVEIIANEDEKAGSPVRVFSGELARSGNFER